MVRSAFDRFLLKFLVVWVVGWALFLVFSWVVRGQVVCDVYPVDDVSLAAWDDDFVQFFYTSFGGQSEDYSFSSAIEASGLFLHVVSSRPLISGAVFDVYVQFSDGQTSGMWRHIGQVIPGFLDTETYLALPVDELPYISNVRFEISALGWPYSNAGLDLVELVGGSCFDVTPTPTVYVTPTITPTPIPPGVVCTSVDFTGSDQGWANLTVMVMGPLKRV